MKYADPVAVDPELLKPLIAREIRQREGLARDLDDICELVGKMPLE